jgi:hypothetical protein
MGVKAAYACVRIDSMAERWQTADMPELSRL